MPVKPLPPNPSLDHLKHQAKDLLKAHTAHDIGAAQRLREFDPNFKSATDAEIFAAHLPLAAAQRAIARERGFPSWPRLKAHIETPTRANQLNLPHHERIEDPTFRRAVALLDAGDATGLRAHLTQHPNLSRQRVLFAGGNYFRNPTLLDFIAENPIRHGTLPPNIVEIAEIVIAAGVDQSSLDETLGLVCSGRIPRECGKQIPLIDLLCNHGADPNYAVQSAAGEAEFEALQALVRRGAQITLPVAAALGRTADAQHLLSGANPEDRHRALALAAQFGRVEIVRLLLDAGEDHSRYNPAGCHAHSTPLHQAALGGHEAVVHLLVERGARLDLKDLLWQGTPAGWANHAGNTEIEAWLRTREK
jgi:hypothetical protein